MNEFIKYLSEKYGFNIDDEFTLFHGSNPIKTKDEIFEYMLSEISIHSKIPKSQILGRTRKREVVYARHLLAYCLYKTKNFYLSDIGFRIGGRDHTTIISAKQVAEDLISVKDEYLYPLYLKIEHLVK